MRECSAKYSDRSHLVQSEKKGRKSLNKFSQDAANITRRMPNVKRDFEGDKKRRKTWMHRKKRLPLDHKSLMF